jgi:hypothetical protein
MESGGNIALKAIKRTFGLAAGVPHRLAQFLGSLMQPSGQGNAGRDHHQAARQFRAPHF